MGRAGVRSAWAEVPAAVRAAVDDALGAPVVETTPLMGGFSPGPAVRARLADGRSVFAKAVGSRLNPHTPGMHRREAEVLRALPPPVPAPRLLHVLDDGDWVVVITEWLDGRAPDPAAPEDVDRVVDLLGALGDTHGSALPGLRPFVDEHPTFGGGWAAIAAAPGLADRLDERTRRHLDRLVAAESDVRAAASGDALVHGDARTDNMVLTDAGDVLVDWAAAALGPPWFDLVSMLPALALDGGPPPAATFERATASGRFGPIGDAVDVVLAALAGFFVGQSVLPDPPGLPTVRAFQAAQGRITTDWLLHRLHLA